jgi:hypothetical protein
MFPVLAGLVAIPGDPWPVGILAAVIVVAGAVILFWRLRHRPTPEELERRRRELVHRTGKIGDGEVLDLDGAMISYSYSVAGVGYTVSQDLSAVIDRMPPDRMAVLGPVSVKFLPRNPANSIVICEEWTGLRRTPPPPRAA